MVELLSMVDKCDNGRITDVNGYFTSEDIVIILKAIEEGNIYSIKGLIEYFNGKYECNRIVEILKNVINRGLKILPKTIFEPITEKLKVEDGVFYLSNKPFSTNGFIFLNNLIVVKYEDGSYDFFDDVDFNPNELKCTINKKINGYATVSYFILNSDYIGGNSTTS